MARRIILDDDLWFDWDGGDLMEFRLTFAGKLYSTGNDSVLSGRDKRANHKHELRMKFHPQLKRLWEETPFLKTGERSGPSALILESSEDTPSYKASYLAKKHTVRDSVELPWYQSTGRLDVGVEAEEVLGIVLFL
jgi:hypothetical protein